MKKILKRRKIAARVEKLGKDITRAYKHKDLVVIGVLNGASLFMADLIRQINLTFVTDLIRVKSYRRGKSTGSVFLDSDISYNIKGKDVLIVEDILDTGVTLTYLLDHLVEKKPASIKICCLLDRGRELTMRSHVHFIGFKIPDQFVVGYGLDYEGKFRNLKDVSILK
jgi:hypoxanthine phosphoribosyltransferase